MTGACTKSYMEISTIQCLYWFLTCEGDKYHGQAYNCDKILLTTGSRLTFFQLRWYKICLALCLLSVQVYHPINGLLFIYQTIIFIILKIINSLTCIHNIITLKGLIEGIQRPPSKQKTTTIFLRQFLINIFTIVLKIFWKYLKQLQPIS